MRGLNGEKKVWNFLGFLLFLYLFLFSVVLIKHSFSEIGEVVTQITQNNINQVNAVGMGWLLTLIMQSSGAATSTLAALNFAGIIGPTILIYMVLGTRIGTTITALLVALFMFSKKRRDFRHGFEIGLANLVYAVPIAIVMFFLEYFFSFFSQAGNYFVSMGVPFKINFIDVITLPLINLLGFIPNYLLSIFGVLLLIFSLKKIPYFMLCLWKEEYLKQKINKYMKKKYFSFFIGFIIAVFLASTSITLILLIPLIVSRVVNLKKVIPYIIGTNLGGIVDAVIGGLVIGKTALPAIFTYVSFSIIGLFWLFNTNLLFNITKFISKKTLHISKKRAILFVLFFVLLAVVLSFV
jgi:sodium-dependent phosphate cotransporter